MPATNRPASTRRLRSLILTGVGLAAIVTTAGVGGGATMMSDDPYSNLPATLVLSGTCRDFRWRTETNGHPDFEYTPTGGYGHYVNQVNDTLDSDGKPVFLSQGYKVNTEARDSAGRNRIPTTKSYIAAKTGDVAGSIATSTGGSTSTSANFAKWFRDVPGTNMSRTIPLTLVRQAGTNTYTFNDQTDATYSGKGGFFPINGDLFGNSPGQSKNFGFTFELSTTFTYKRGAGQVFTFTGDDDVFVFVDGKLVVDIGGVHGATSQTIELDRLTWLIDGNDYPLKLFFAERHTTQSNVRIDTTLTLRPADLPADSALAD